MKNEVRWYRFDPETKEVFPAPSADDMEAFKAYSKWLYGNNEDGRPTKSVAFTDIDDHTHVSTVFLGLDHGWNEGPPIIFETMVFVDGNGEEMERYCTWDEAVEGHNKMVVKVTCRNLTRDKLEAAAKVIRGLTKYEE